MTLEVRGNDGIVKAAGSDDGQAQLVYSGAYQPGDEIILRSESKNVYLILQLDDAMGPAFVYLTDNEYRFAVPFGEKKVFLFPESLCGRIACVDRAIGNGR